MDMSGCAAARPKGPGRPVQIDHQEREALVLDATVDVLCRLGARRASMAAIARQAGMSKRTLYALFPSREALIAACVRRVRAALVRPLTEAQAGLPFAERLRLLLTPDAALMEDPAPLELLRIAVSEARTSPEVAQSLIAEGLAPVLAAIRQELERAAQRGEIAVDDLDAAAMLLRDMVYESPCDLLLDPARAPKARAQVTARVDLAIRVFLRGFAPLPA